MQDLRPLTLEEATAVERAIPLLTALTYESPYLKLQTSHSEFVSALDSYSEATDQQSVYERASIVRSRFRHWLADFNSTRDRGRSWIINALGENHPALAMFDSNWEREKQDNFFFRLSWELRNASTHTHDVLTNLSFGAFMDSDGKQRTLATAAVDANKALGVSKRLSASVRSDLSVLTKPIDARVLTARTMDSALSVFARLVKGLEPDLAPLIKVVLTLHNEAVAAGGTHSLVGTAEYEKTGQLQLSQYQNPWQQAQALEGQFAEYTESYTDSLRQRFSAVEGEAESSKVIALSEYVSGKTTTGEIHHDTALLESILCEKITLPSGM